MAFNLCTSVISCLYHYLRHANALCVNRSFCYFLCRFRRYLDDYMGVWQVYCTYHDDDDDVLVHNDDDDGCFQF